MLHGGPRRVRQAQGGASPSVAAPFEAFEHCPDAVISPFLAVHVAVAPALGGQLQRQPIRRLAEVQVALLRNEPEVVCRIAHYNLALLLAIVGGAQRQALRRERHGGGRGQRAPHIHVRPCRGFLGVVCSILQRVAVVLLRRDVRRLAIFDDRPVRIVEPCGHQRGVVPGFPDAHGEEDAVRLDGAAVRQFQFHHELHRVGAVPKVGRRYAERPVGRRTGDAPVLGVRAVHIAAQGLRAGTAQGVGYAEGLAACYGRGDVERAAQGQLHHVDAPRHLGHLHLRAFADLHTHPHGIGAHTHILRHVHRVRAACGYGLRQRAGVRTLSDGHGHTAGVAGALSGRGVRLVVGVSQFHLVAGLDGLVRGDARQHDLRRGHRAATAAREHVARADDLPGLVQQGERIGLVRALADFIELQGGAVGGGLLVYRGSHGLAAHCVGRVLVDRLVDLHYGYVYRHAALLVGRVLLRGRAARYRDFLDSVRAAVPVPCRSGQERRYVSTLETVFFPFPCADLDCNNHSRLVVIVDVSPGECRHGRLLCVVAARKGYLFRHVVEAAA